MKSSKENISPTSFDYFRQLCASRQNREKTDKSISEELFVPQVTLFSNSSKQILKNDKQREEYLKHLFKEKK